MQAETIIQEVRNTGITDPHDIYCAVRNRLWFMPAKEIRTAMDAAGVAGFDGLVDPRLTTISDGQRSHGFAGH